ncbi:MAG: hypothetical protein KDD34_06870, partial [Bdellovibrionales bacterium]|nr:hypothetical protein [Bdellovibrionales bacterium]
MRNSFIIIVSWAILIGLGCSTTPTQHLPPVANLLPPHIPIETKNDVENVDYYLLKAAEKQTTQEYQWWITYKRANIWKEQKPQLSCEKFANLARDPIFPLAQIAYLHAFEICPKNAPELAGMRAFDYKNFPSWMQKKALDVELSRAELNNDKQLIMELSYEKSKEYLPIETKIELTKTSLVLASELKNRPLIKKFQSRLYKLQPSENPQPSRGEWLSVAYDFRRLRNFKKADEYYKK